MKKTVLMIMILFLFSGCIEYKDDPLCSEYRFLSLQEVRDSVTIRPPQEIQNVGKIYVYANLLIVSDKGLGIHIIDNTNKSSPAPLAFIAMLGNVDIAVKDGYLYADNFIDLVVFDLNDLKEIKEANRVEDVFSYDRYQKITDYDRRYIVENVCHFSDEKGFVVEKKR